MYSDLYYGMKWKINLIGLLIFLMLLALVFRILYIQVFKSIDYKNFLQKQIIKKDEIRNLRGSIYDRNGEILAFSLFKTSYFCFPQKIQDINSVRNFAIAKLNIAPEKIDELLEQKSGFFWLKRQADEEFEISELPKAVECIKEEKRVYPNNNLASHVLGYTGLDNNGLSGIEYQFDNLLRGAVIKTSQEKDARGRNLSAKKIFLIEDNKSQNIFLTIDKNIQVIAEKYLDELMTKSKPKNATVIIQNIKTGEILAMANRPDFNGNNFTSSDVKNLKNRAVSDIYEPGSTIKILVAGIALQEGVFDIYDKIYCENGKYEIYDRVIRDHDKKHKNITIEDILVYSSNIGMAKIGEKLGKNLLYRYFQKFNFGTYTGIELPAEAVGILNKPMYWYDISPYILSFGQGIGATSIQMINAFSAVANLGVMMEPHIIKSVEDDGKLENTKIRPVRKILSPEHCKTLLKSMYLVVEKGTAMDARVSGYKVGGKTGTAQKIDPNTKKYSDKEYIASFIGVLPLDNPEISILVMADSPVGLYWGGNVCGPIFRDIAADIAYYLRIPRTEQ